MDYEFWVDWDSCTWDLDVSAFVFCTSQYNNEYAVMVEGRYWFISSKEKRSAPGLTARP